MNATLPKAQRRCPCCKRQVGFDKYGFFATHGPGINAFVCNGSGKQSGKGVHCPATLKDATP